MSKATATVRTEVSSRYRFFRWVILFLSVAQLLIGLDYITIWPGAEAEFIWESWRPESPFSLFSAVLGGIPLDSDYWLLAFRLPSLLFYAGALYLFYRWGKPLLGQQAVELTLIVGAASLLLPVLAKMAALDIWQWAGTMVFWLAALRYAKGPSNFWLGMMALGGVWALLNGAYFGLFVIWQIGYSWLFFKGDRPAQLRFAIPLMVLFFTALFNYWAAGELNNFQYFDLESWDNLRLLLFSFLGILPFIGFTLAGLRDMVYKIRRGEELARIIGIGLLGAFLVPSLMLPFLLIFLTAKQVQHYFQQPNYPWQNWAKGGMVLHLIFVFIAVVLALLGGFANFQTDGFRAVLGCSAAYWMFSFVGVIGLYGMRRDYVIGGMTLAGVLGLLFFWVQVYPFLHLQRNWPERITQQLEKVENAPETYFMPPTYKSVQPLAPYLLRKDWKVMKGDSTTAAGTYGYFTDVIQQEEDSIKRINPFPEIAREKGWSGLYDQVEIVAFDARQAPAD